MKNSFWCADVSWLCNLFYFAGQSGEDWEVDEYSAIRGFLFTICRILKKENPVYLVAAIDSNKSFRKDLDETYKGHRKDKEEGYVQQLGQIKEVTDALGIPQICVDGYEADDVMCTLSKRASIRKHTICCFNSR